MSLTPARIAWVLLMPLFVASATGCGDKPVDNPPPPVPGDGGSGSDRGVREAPEGEGGTAADGPRDSRDGQGSDGGGGGGGSASVTVNIVDPRPMTFVRKSARFAPQVDFTVVTPGGPPDVLNTNNVVATIVKDGTTTKLSSTKLNLSTSTPDPMNNSVRYTFADSPIDIAAMKNDVYEMTIAGETLGGAHGEAAVKFEIDGGPTIRIITPQADKHYKGSAVVQADITDVLAPVSNVVITVGSKPPLTVTPPGSSDGQGVYTATIDFAALVLDDQQLLKVSAANKNGTTNTGSVQFVVDNRGPVIAEAKPSTGDIIGQVIKISARVTDPAGVLPSSVVAVVAHGGANFEKKLDPPGVGGMDGVYSTLFDTTILPLTALFPTISFRASDMLGNESSVGYNLSLDNTAPLADLDPPDHYRTVLKQEGALRCSWEMDTVGPDAVDDGDMVPQVFDIRARVEDQGNTPVFGDTDYTPLAAVSPDQVHLLVLDDATQALVVDGDEDKDPRDPTKPSPPEPWSCDRINPNLVPTTTPRSSSDALLVNMTSLAVAGAPDMWPDADYLVESGECFKGSGNAPNIECETTVNWHKVLWDFRGVTPNGHGYWLNQVIRYGTIKESSIWTLGPVVSDGVSCAGRQFDAFANNISDGWACLAVDSRDKLGNRQVSRPVRVCIDHDGSEINDGSGGACPHVRIFMVSDGNPFQIVTLTPHGLATGDEVILSGVPWQSKARGRWKVTVVDGTTFSLDDRPTCNLTLGGAPDCGVGSTLLPTPALRPPPPAPPARPNCDGDTVCEPASGENCATCPDCPCPPLPTGYSECNNLAPLTTAPCFRYEDNIGHVVKASTIPRCTGTITSHNPPTPTVDASRPCKPWRDYPREERRYQP